MTEMDPIVSRLPGPSGAFGGISLPPMLSRSFVAHIRLGMKSSDSSHHESPLSDTSPSFNGRKAIIKSQARKMTTPGDGRCLRELDEHLSLHPSLEFLPFEVEYLDVFLPPPAPQAVVAPVVAPAQLVAQNDNDDNV